MFKKKKGDNYYTQIKQKHTTCKTRVLILYQYKYQKYYSRKKGKKHSKFVNF